jgi:hypothetical protein
MMARDQAIRWFGFLAGTAMSMSLGGVADAANPLPGVFTGNAQAALAQATDVSASLATTAQQFCSCQGTNGQVIKNSVGAVSVGPLTALFSSGGTTSAIHTNKTANAAMADNWSEISNLSLLGGMITADAIRGEAKVQVTKGAVTLTTGSSAFTNLKIAGKSYPANPAPNTRITLPSIGTVTLNAQHKINDFSSPKITVDMISVKITNPNGFTIPGVPIPVGLPLPPGVSLPAGAVVDIGHAVAGYNRQEPKAAVSGSAYGSNASTQVGTPLLLHGLGRTAAVNLGCEGTGGGVVKSQDESANALNIAVVNQASSTAQSGSKNGGQFATMTSTVQSLTLLGGLIKGTNIRASAQETLTNGKLTASTANSGFDQMTILGVPVPANAKPNTGRTLPGFGTVMVNEQIKGAKPGDPTTVNGLHINISAPNNALMIPVGTDIVFAHASVTVAPLPQ